MNFILPFEGTWLTSWGGDTKKLNIHHDIVAQKYAFDFVVADSSGKTYQNEGKINADYFAYGKSVLAPADGKIVEVVNGVRDNRPGDTNPYMKTGNYVLIKHSDNEFSFLAHLKRNSISVKTGEDVITGQILGQCGNSGNSSDPHLHYHLQDSFIFNRFGKDWKIEDVARGIKVQFTNILVETDGGKKVHESYSPIKGEYVRNCPHVTSMV